ncbi:MAG: hypothetical protein JF606_06595 [Burkholderiales bacterium]|nr:hypothetical protein [Burkholderiales bacterium]
MPVCAAQNSCLTEEQIRLIGVARWPDPDFNREGAPANQQYGRRFHAAVMEGALGIAENRIGSFEQLWNFVRNARYQWEKTDSKKRTDKSWFDLQFLFPRHKTGLTPINNKLAYIEARLSQRELEFEPNPRKPIPENRSYMGHRIFQMKDTLTGKEIQLTKLAFPVDPSDFESTRAKNLRSAGEPLGYPAYIQHSGEEHIGNILAHLESIFADVMRNPGGRDQLLGALADMHWWSVHAMPDNRGSAAKAEMAVRALAVARGLELPPFKRGMVPDIEAFLTDRQAFRAGYAEMFDGPVRGRQGQVEEAGPTGPE